MTRKIDRREAIKWVLTASASVSLLHRTSLGATAPLPVGYGTDPKLMEVYKPGDLWPLTFSAPQRQRVAALCDVILPADDKSPSASQLNVPDFIDEWISAPYGEQREDRKRILEGLDWLEKQSTRRFKHPFHELTEDQKRQICDEVCFEPKAKAAFKKPAQFFNRFRELTLSAFYTTPEGMKDIEYIGNVALTKFEGPPPEVLKYLKLD